MRINIKLQDKQNDLGDAKGNYCIRCNSFSARTVKRDNGELLFICPICKFTVNAKESIRGA